MGLKELDTQEMCAARDITNTTEDSMSVIAVDEPVLPNELPTLGDSLEQHKTEIPRSDSGKSKEVEVLDDLGSVSKERIPKRILHFCDGVLEEYSSSDEDEEAKSSISSKDKTDIAIVDTQSMSWIPYIWYLASWCAWKTLAACDYLGENLAYFFGITTPKYQFEIEQYQQMLEVEESEKQQALEENAGWQEKQNGELSTVKVDVQKFETDNMPINSVQNPSSSAENIAVAAAAVAATLASAQQNGQIPPEERERY